MKILQLKSGQHARILGFHPNAEPAYRASLLSMGLTPGTDFTVSRVAPLGDPIEIEVRGYFLSLRKNEASVLRIEQVNP